MDFMRSPVALSNVKGDFPRPTQPSFPPGSVNEYQLVPAGKQRQVWFIPLADERGVCR